MALLTKAIRRCPMLNFGASSMIKALVYKTDATQINGVDSGKEGVHKECNICGRFLTSLDEGASATVLPCRLHNGVRLVSSSQDKVLAVFGWHNKRIKSCYCKPCKKAFRTESAFKDHLMAKHIPKPSFFCIFCMGSYYDKESYVTHMRNKHSDYWRGRGTNRVEEKEFIWESYRGVLLGKLQKSPFVSCYA